MWNFHQTWKTIIKGDRFCKVIQKQICDVHLFILAASSTAPIGLPYAGLIMVEARWIYGCVTVYLNHPLCHPGGLLHKN
jgi:hypothetical protein